MICVPAGAALLANLVLTGTASAAGGSVGPADTTINGDTVSTNISVREYGRSETVVDPGYQGPSCWLAPFGGDGQTPVPTYTPSEFADYGNNVIAVGNSSGPVLSEDGAEMQSIYQVGNPATNSVVRLSAPPYNTGLNGSWDWIVCSINADYGTILNFEGQLGVNNDYESWFWVGNGGVAAPTISGNVLADYAAASMTVSDQWPDTKPDLQTTKQTVNLPVQVTNAPGANGYHRYVATATLAVDPAVFSQVTATPETLTITSPSLPKPVNCTFSTDPAGNSSLNPGCTLVFDKATPAGSSTTVKFAVEWTVTWNEDPGAGGWPKGLPVDLTQPVAVQEIQTVVNGNTSGN